MTAQDLHEAIAGFRKAIELDSNNSSAHHGLGLVLASKKDLVGAIAAFREAIRLAPSTSTYHNLANSLMDNKDLEGAIAEYNTAIQLEAKYAPAHLGLGFALIKKKDLDGAMQNSTRPSRSMPSLLRPTVAWGLPWKEERPGGGNRGVSRLSSSLLAMLTLTANWRQL